MFYCPEDNFHVARFDNLYMATRFGLNSFWHKKHMLVKGVCRTDACGVPSGVLQAKVMGKDRINAVKGTVKVAVCSRIVRLWLWQLAHLSLH